MRRPGQGGFTLIEVMIALGILAIGLVALLRTTAGNITTSQRAQMLTAATNLARGKMYDLEERLLVDGYQELDILEEGNFEEEGWPLITWRAEIIKIELPDMATLQGLTGTTPGEQPTAAAQDAGPPGDPAAAAAAAEEGGGGLLGMFGLTGDPASGGMGGAMMGTYYSLVSDVLKEAIRKVTLTISYPTVGGEMESFVVTCYFTDPAVVNRKVPQAGGGEEGEGTEDGAEGEDRGTGTGSGTGTGTGSGTGTGTGTGTGDTGGRGSTPR
jgi:general secretion pathway protein I